MRVHACVCVCARVHVCVCVCVYVHACVSACTFALCHCVHVCASDVCIILILVVTEGS